MNWTNIKSIEGFRNYSYNNWDKAIRVGFLIYFPETRNLTLVEINSLELYYQEDLLVGDNIYYFVDKNKIFLRVDNRLLLFSFENKSFFEICKTNEEYISLLNEIYCMGRTITPRPRKYFCEIVEISTAKTLYSWNDRSMPVYTSETGMVVFENLAESILKLIDITSGIELWSLKLEGFSVPRFYKNISDEIFLVMQSFDTDHPTDKRFELWGIHKLSGEVLYKSGCEHFDRFIYDEEKMKLYGINGQQYLCLDPFTGEIFANKVVAQLNEGSRIYWADLGNQTMSGDDIYFIVFGKPIVGRFNILSERVEEYIEIPVDETKVDMRQPLNIPFYHKGRLYVRDNSAVLHILQSPTA